MSRWIEGWALALSLCASGCGTQYLTAAGAFASAAQASTTTLAGMPPLNEDICDRRAWISYATLRMENANTSDGQLVSATDPAVYWKDWRTKYTKVTPAGGNWQQFCAEIETSDAIAQKGLAALSTYATALSTITNGDYSGASITTLVTSTSALVGQIPKAPSQASAVVAALAGPMGQLESVLLKSYAAKHLPAIVQDADPQVRAILAALTAYFTAVSADETRWEAEEQAVVQGVDQSKFDGPTQFLEFQRFAYGTMSAVKAARAKRTAMMAALTDLTNAEQALRKADGSNDAPSLSSLVGLASQLLGDVAAVRAAAQQGASQ